MKNSYKILLLLITIMFFACAEEKHEESHRVYFENPRPFSIRLEYNNLEKTELNEIFISLGSKLLDTVYLYDGNIQIGLFETAFEAGDKAFDLYRQSKISDYKITDSTGVIFDEFRFFPFIGKYLNRPALYLLDLLKKKSSLVWEQWGRKILSAKFYSNRNNAFFITALTYGREGNFPFITESRLYHYSKISGNINLLRKYGNGNQFYIQWIADDTLETVFTHIDSAYSSHYIKETDNWTTDLNNFEGNKEYFDIISGGFPAEIPGKLNYFSPSKNFRVLLRKGEGENIIYLLDKINKEENILLDSVKNISDIKWSDDSRYCFVVCNRNSFRENYTLFVYNNESRSGRSLGFNTPVQIEVYGSLLAYNSGYNDEANIVFSDYDDWSTYFKLEIEGGCGLNSIPDSVNLN